MLCILVKGRRSGGTTLSIARLSSIDRSSTLPIFLSMQINASMTFVALVISLALANFAAAVLSPDSCHQNVDLPELTFSASSLGCQVVWSEYDFVLRYNYNSTSKILSILLSANFMQNWFAMGFSPSGNMVGSSAMVGYWGINGGGSVTQYYLAGKSSSTVLPNEGNLTVIKGSEMVQPQNSTIYMAFQLFMDESLAASSKVIYAFAYKGQLPDPTSGVIAQPHENTSQQSFDFTTGEATPISSSTETLRRNHGAINIIGWAVVAPIGAFVARYCRQWDPIWFYLHGCFQTLSFLLAIGGVVLGVRLTHELPTANWHGHKALGIFVFSLGTLQVMAFCTRPHKESKIRIYWNWFHHNIGRIALFLAAINIVVGLKLAGASHSWWAGYAVLVVFTLLSFTILETISWYKWYKHRQEPVRPRTIFSTYDVM